LNAFKNYPRQYKDRPKPLSHRRGKQEKEILVEEKEKLDILATTFQAKFVSTLTPFPA
jgi:hypothetical protein